MRRDDGEMGEGPFAAFDFDAFGDAEFQKVADGGGKDEFVAFKKVGLFGKSTERPSDVGRHRRFFCNNQCFAHSIRIRTIFAY